MQITFARSGGFPGALRNVKGTIQLENGQGVLTSDGSYRRDLTPAETSQIRAGADPEELAKAARKIAARTARSADLDHFEINVTTKDGKSRRISLNSSLSSNELQGVPPEVISFLRWLQEAAQAILTHRVSGK